MTVQQTLAAMGFVTESDWNCDAMVWRGKDYTWVATGTDGCTLPTDDDWLICEYAGNDWDEREADNRSFDNNDHYLADVIAAMLA